MGYLESLRAGGNPDLKIKKVSTPAIFAISAISGNQKTKNSNNSRNSNPLGFEKNQKIAEIAEIATHGNFKNKHTPDVEYKKLWAEAWELADWVDGEGAPYEQRVVKLPDLLAMVARIDELETLLKRKSKNDY